MAAFPNQVVFILLQVTIKVGPLFLSSEKFMEHTSKETHQAKKLYQKNLISLKNKKPNHSF